MDPVDYSDKRDDASKAPPSRLGATQSPPTSPRLASDPNAKAAADAGTSKNWRSERLNRSRSSNTMAIPTSQQDLMLWLQYGGWRYVAGLAALVILLVIIIMLMTRNNGAAENTTNNASTAQGGFELLPTAIPQELDLGISAGPAQNNQLGAQLRVTGTDTEGLFLRLDPNTNNQPLKTMPEGTIVTIKGEDYIGSDRIWKYVVDDAGVEGWAAADWLAPVNP
jgi:hypothetical protein